LRKLTDAFSSVDHERGKNLNTVTNNVTQIAGLEERIANAENANDM
jgi:hypothetical protein